MTNKTLFIFLCMGALCGCGEEEDPACNAGSNCGAGTYDAQTSPTTTTNGADAGSASNDAGSGASNNPGNNPMTDAGPSVASDAGQPGATDSGTPTASGDAGQGAPAAGGPAKASAGCGAAAPMSGNATIDVAGTSRAYILTLPTPYDPMQPYKLVFAWHGLGGSAQQIATTYYGLKSRSANGTIFVSGQGLPTSGTATGAGAGGAGWANTGGQDVAFVKALYARLQGQVCFDENRVFSVGMSYGGIMSNTLGCSMGDVFRAIAPMSGMGPGFGGRATCTGQVAVWMSNGDNDAVVSTSSERASKDFWVKTNHCQTTSAPVDPSPCVAFAGCDQGYPVTWCEFAGGHQIPPFSAAAIWTFFSQF